MSRKREWKNIDAESDPLHRLETGNVTARRRLFVVAVAALVVASGVVGFLAGVELEGGFRTSSPPQTIVSQSYLLPPSVRSPSQNGVIVSNETGLRWFNASFRAPGPVNACVSNSTTPYLTEAFSVCALAPDNQTITNSTDGTLSLELTNASSPGYLFAVEDNATHATTVSYNMTETFSDLRSTSLNGSLVVVQGSLVPTPVFDQATLPAGYSVAIVRVTCNVSIFSAAYVLGGLTDTDFTVTSNGTVWTSAASYSGQQSLALTVYLESLMGAQLQVEISVQ